MPKPIRFKFLVLALLALITLGIHQAEQVRAEMRSPPTDTHRGPDRTPAFGSAAKPHPGTARSDPAGIALSAAVDRRAVLHNGDGTVHIEVTIRTPPAERPAVRQATDMIVIVDRSGSMSGGKIYFAQEALRQLIDRLRPEDRFGLVAYDTYAQTLIPLEYASDRAQKRWRHVVDRLNVRGNTNMSHGLDLGQQMLEDARLSNRPARLLLLSDGLANTGDSSFEGLTRRARRAARGQYVLSTMGIGADFDERLMTALASAGTGAFYYLAKLEVLPEFFDAELLTAGQTVAYGTVLEIQLEPGVRVNSVMGLPFQQRGTKVTVPIGSLYSGHERTLWITAKVPTGRLAEFPLGSVGARFRIADGDHETDRHALPRLRCVATYSEFRDSIRADVWERAMLNESIGRSQERFGDAIASGTAADIDKEYTAANRHRRLATELGVQSVVRRLDQLEKSAQIAKQAQRAPAPVRRAEAKRQKASGYIERNRDSYLNADPRTGF